MGKAMVMRGAVAILVGAALTPVAVATAQTATQNGTAQMQSRAQPRAQTVLRRDGSKAVPFKARRSAAAPADGVHAGDGLIGVAGALGLILLASATLLSGSRRSDVEPNPS
jgi:hypothetical protein